MKKIWVHKARSFKEEEQFERYYYQKFSPNQRVETVDRLRQMAGKFQKVGNGRKRLRRIIRIIQ